MSPIDTDGTSTVETTTSNDQPIAAPETQSQPDVSSPSSSETPGTPAESRETLLSAITKAVAPDQGQQAPSDEPPPVDKQAGQPQAQAAEEGEIPAQITEQELASYRPRTRKRIEQLLGQNRDLTGRLEAAEREAGGTRELQKFLKDQDISKEDFGLTLDLAAAMRRGDFKTFLEGVAPYVQLAQEALGLSLPDDLHAAVQAGHMSQEAAAYTSRLRYEQRLAQANAMRYEQRTQDETRSREAEQFTQRVTNAVSQWEAGIRSRDPDYAAKESVIRDLLPAVVEERGAPRNEAEAVAIAEAAYARANQMLSRFAPKPQRTQPVPSSISRVNGAMPEPKSMLEAAQQALRR